MSFTVLSILGMLVLFKFSGTAERWWIAFAIIITTAALLGIQVGMISLAIAIGVWKVISDIGQAGNQS
jgi:hypothetical protein